MTQCTIYDLTFCHNAFDETQDISYNRNQLVNCFLELYNEGVVPW